MDKDLGHDASDLSIDFAGGELVPESLLEEVANQRLALGAAHIERHRGDQVPRLLVLQEDVPHLRAVPVRQDDVMARRDKIREARCRRLDPAALGRRVRGFAAGCSAFPPIATTSLVIPQPSMEVSCYFEESIRT